ncbi:carbamoyltransferase [Microbulbifer sp. ZKSA004]|uniref:carbamoyltransferase family protein n=1 Tax=Microbulbifer sp. ZKSA004 TaxID=3243389 RepID=UPI00403A6142
MYILGLHVGDKLEAEFNRNQFTGHDAAAVLLKDGEIISGIEEERLSRVKHCNFFPRRAIQFCLDSAGITISDVDYIALNCSKYDGEIKNAFDVYNNSSKSWQTGDEVNAEYLRLLFKTDLQSKLIYCSHHEAHAWSAFVPSGFHKSLVVVFDGNGPSGDGRLLSGVIGINDGFQYTTIRELSDSQSLGTFYRNIIRSIGYNRFDEYKVMGLAPYGNPHRFLPLMKEFYDLKEDGKFTIVRNPSLEIWKKELSTGLIPPRRKGEPFTQIHKDFAASVQYVIEDIALHCIRYFQKSTGINKLSFAGGVAHNCTLNKKIIESGLFDEVYVQPAAHDAGCAIGAAYYAYHLVFRNPPKPMSHIYWGTNLPNQDKQFKYILKWGALLNVSKMDDTCTQVAQLIANNSVVGWVQGQSEFGPRALGNRSILADPRPLENKTRINQMIKKREGYRPFAPSVLAQEADRFFHIPMESRSLQYMNVVVDVVEDKQSFLGAITHVDGTARIQAVKPEYNEKYWKLIKCFGDITGVPILLNTSFNNNVEPIVDSIDDAISCYLTTDLTHLVIGDFLITRNCSLSVGIKSLHLSIKPSYVVTKGCFQSSRGYTDIYTIESKASRFFQVEKLEITKELFGLLSYGIGVSIEQSCNILNIPLTETLLNEIIQGWNMRVLTLTPI